MTDLVSAPRAAFVLLLLALWTALLLPVQFVAVVLGMRLAHVVPALYHRGNCWLIGLEVRRDGEPEVGPPALFVCNHSSYLDIVVLLTMLDACFVAKSEVAGWPLFGLLAKLVNTVFVDRKPSRSRTHHDEMRQRLAAGDRLILFPEGTSSDGNRVLPFKSTFFAVAEHGVGGKPVAVQPISLSYTRLNHLPIGRRERPFLAWYGDMGLVTHLWRLLRCGHAAVEVRFHRPVTIEQFGSRKALAAACHHAVAVGVSELLSGRHSTSQTAEIALARSA